MSTDNVMEFYEALGFEETRIEDGLTALFFEVSPEGIYGLLTSEEGTIPESLRQTVIFACYTPESSFLWSASFKNSYVFKDIWSEAQTPQHKLDAVQKHRESNDYYK